MAGMGGIILYIVFLGAIVYFMAIRPQNKERKKQQELLASVAVGDTILTSSGFYGVIKAAGVAARACRNLYGKGEHR